MSGIVQVARNPEAMRWLQEHAIEPEEGAVIIRRTLRQNGRGAVYIQSTPVTRAQLYELTSQLFDFHGQHEHQSLLELENHRKLLDRYAGLEAGGRVLPRALAEAAAAARAVRQPGGERAGALPRR